MKKQPILVTRSSMPPYEEYIEAIKPLWDNHWLTNMGTYHNQLEDELKKFLSVPYVSLTVNGHMALELAIQAFDFPEGAEIITTPFTFISTTHAIIRNHLTPVFCDVKAEDGTIDENKIEALITDRTVAIVPVHVYGNVCNVEAIDAIAKKHHLKVIYDAAHAFGVTYKGKGIASYGDAAIFSFHATKVFNTVEGGAVAFHNPELYEKLYNLKNFGIRGEELVVDVGANAKMNEFSAIMGLCNLKYVPKTIEERQKRWCWYQKALSSVKGIRMFVEQDDVVRNYAYFPIIVEDDFRMSRDELYDLLREKGIYSRKYFYPLTCDHEIFEGKYWTDGLLVARELSHRVLSLPFHDTLEKETIEYIVGVLIGNKRRTE